MRAGKLTPGTKGISQARVRKEYRVQPAVLDRIRCTSSSRPISKGVSRLNHSSAVQETSRQSSMTQRGFGEVVLVRSGCHWSLVSGLISSADADLL